MKKFLIGLFVFSTIFMGSLSVQAQGLQGLIDGAQQFAEDVAERGGEINRDITEFNLKLEYFARPFSEKNLTFDDWLSLYGYTTSGGVIPHGDLVLPSAEEFGEIGANTDLRKFILNVLNWVLSFLGLIAIAVVIYAGYLCIITGGDDGSEKCKKILMYVAIGIIIILISFALVNTLIRSTTEGGDNFAGIQTSISSNLETGSITVTGGGAIPYEGKNSIVESGKLITFTLDSHTLGEPYDIQWSFGDGTVDPSSGLSSERVFFDEGFKNITVIGKIKESIDIEGSDTPEIVVHDYIARVKVLVGNSVISSFTMNPQTPEINESVHFNANTSQAIVGLITEYNWECVSDPVSLCADFPTDDNDLDFTFLEAGEVTVSLEVVANVGNSATFSETFTISSLAVDTSIQANFRVSSMSPVRDAMVEFSGRIIPTGVADSYNWECVVIGSPSDICVDFNDIIDGSDHFYASFPETGSAKISLVVEKNGVVSAPVEKILHILEPGGIAPGVTGGINFDSPTAIWVEDEAEFSVMSAGDEEYSSYKWTFLDGEKTGESVVNTFQNVGENKVKLEALDADGEIIAEKEENVLVAEKDFPIPVLSINGSNVYPSDLIEILVGNSLEFQTNSFDGSGNQGDSANVTHSWVLNGAVIDKSMLSDLSERVGTYVVKVNAISTLDSNKRTALQFKIKVSNETPKVNLVVSASSLGAGFFTMKANVTTEKTIAKQYKFTISEKGKVISTQVINSREKNIETVMDVSNKTGERNYIFQVTMVDVDNMTAKKSVTKNVTIEAEEVTNNAPTVEIFTTPATSGLTSTMFRFYTQTDDVDNDFLTYKWEFPNGKKTIGKTASHKFLTPGINTVKVTVSDGLAETIATETISVEEDLNFAGNNKAPVMLSSGMSPGNTGDTNTIFKFYAFAEDADGDELDYSWIMGDGNRINLQNVSYTYQFPGRYMAKLIISDGQKTITKSIPIIVVEGGAVVPDSTIVDYESENDISGNTGFATSEVAINSNLTAGNVAEFSGQVDTALVESEVAATELTSELNPAQVNSLNENLAEMSNMTEEELAVFLENIGIDDDFDINKFLNIQKEISIMEDMNALLSAYESETDPIRKKNLLNEINQKRIELELLNAKLQFTFIGLEGGTNTKFFFYSKIPKSNRPVLIKWDTGDNRSFIGQNVSWKYAKTGNYVVQMEVSDGISVATDSINIKIK